MKNFIKWLLIVLFIALIGCVVAYFCVPSVKDWTNKKFGLGEYKATFTIEQTTRDKVDSERFVLPESDNVLISGLKNLVELKKNPGLVFVPQSVDMELVPIEEITYKNRINKIEIIVNKDNEETKIEIDTFNVVQDNESGETYNYIDKEFAISFALSLENVDSVQILLTLNEFDNKTTVERSNILRLKDVTENTVII